MSEAAPEFWHVGAIDGIEGVVRGATGKRVFMNQFRIADYLNNLEATIAQQQARAEDYKRHTERLDKEYRDVLAELQAERERAEKAEAELAVTRWNPSQTRAYIRQLQDTIASLEGVDG